MANKYHGSLVEADGLHDAKGAGASTSGQVLVSTGGASTWKKLVPSDSVDATGENQGRVLLADGAGGANFDVTVWKDLTGDIHARSGGVAPTARLYRAGVYQYSFSAGNSAFVELHMPHDYKPNTDIYLHVHWSHITAGSSTTAPVFDWAVIYAKGHNQSSGGLFGDTGQTAAITQTGTATVPQYRHVIEEFQLSSSTPSATKLDTAKLEVDGVILINFTATTLPGAVGASDFFVHFIDVHYQSDYVGTKNKAPNFYS